MRWSKGTASKSGVGLAAGLTPDRTIVPAAVCLDDRNALTVHYRICRWLRDSGLAWLNRRRSDTIDGLAQYVKARGVIDSATRTSFEILKTTATVEQVSIYRRNIKISIASFLNNR
ncbi:hypothetical protein QH494_25715 [Sphingomonas sp. AR_OL41]|uniref:hypothetical protein n=1 Tax=Sphingomonas sp. AR_OL41 TaxID=3042729 RepID=UPI002480FDE8|nr:hypothetical protein [Sphingomonas sp. AR_OL41]MDH7975596.1 hypothetical protein [Sphingomonas sp. AR_OL41]